MRATGNTCCVKKPHESKIQPEPRHSPPRGERQAGQTGSVKINSVQPAASVTRPASHVDKEQAARLLRVISKHPKLKLHLLQDIFSDVNKVMVTEDLSFLSYKAHQ